MRDFIFFIPIASAPRILLIAYWTLNKYLLDLLKELELYHFHALPKAVTVIYGFSFSGKDSENMRN